MRNLKWKCVGMMILALVSPLAYPQSLAAVASKERARKKKAPAASSAKVYTENDLAGSESSGSETKGDPIEPASGASVPGGADPTVITASRPRSSRAEQAGSETYWRDRVSRTRAAITRAESRVSDLERQSAKQALDGNPKPGKCNIPASVARQGDAAMKRWSCTVPTRANLAPGLEAARQAVESAKRAVGVMEDEARHAGVPAAWLR